MKSLYQLFDLARGERIYARNVFVQVCTEFNRCKYYSFKCTKHAVEIASRGVSYNADLKKKWHRKLVPQESVYPVWHQTQDESGSPECRFQVGQ